MGFDFGEHAGLSPLTEKKKALSPALKVMARLKILKSVPDRRAVLVPALADIASDDPFWMEALVSALTDRGIDSAPAHLCALAVAEAVCSESFSALARDLNEASGQGALNEFADVLVSVAPEIAERALSRHLDSDELFLRALLIHAFRRDLGNKVQVFVCDGAADLARKALDGGVVGFVGRLLEQPSAADVPLSAWGYVLVLHGMQGKSGYYLRAPTQADREMAKDIEGRLRAAGLPSDDQRVANALVAGAVSALGPVGPAGLVSPMVAAFDRLGIQYALVYSRQDDGGTHTQIIPEEADDVHSARLKLASRPEVSMHTQMREMASFFSSMSSGRKPNS